MFEMPTLFGIIAILLWSLLALFTTASGAVPPFQLVAFCFTVAAIGGFVFMGLTGRGFGVLRQPLPVWLLGVGGLFGYHFFYFTALRNAPAVEAGLIAYLWPLLIVLLSALLPGEQLKWHHVVGGLIGLLGAGLLVTGGNGFSFQSEYLFGYGAAVACAFIWSIYSVLSRRFASVPSEIVAGFCAGSAVLAIFAHLAFETTIWPQTNLQWLALSCLALGPVGIAFTLWDYGVKHGDIQFLGAASYAAPVLSTLILIAAGFGEATWTIALATLLVTIGAVLAARDMIWKKD